MQIKNANVAFMGLLLVAVNHGHAADKHRVVILDIGRSSNDQPGSDDHNYLFVVEIESGRVGDKKEIGRGANVELSPKGEMISAISSYPSRNKGLPANLYLGDPNENHLALFEAKELKLIEEGLFPGGIGEILPGGKEMVVQGIKGTNWSTMSTVLGIVKLQLQDGMYKRSPTSVEISSSAIDILRITDWPRVVIWCKLTSLLEVVDFKAGKILTRLAIADDPLVQKIDPLELEKSIPPNPPLGSSIRGKGWVIPGDGRHAYFIPYPSCDPSYARRVGAEFPRDIVNDKPGYIRKIDLTTNPPKVVQKASKPELNLRSGINQAMPARNPQFPGPGLLPGVVSDSAGKLFIVYDKRDKRLRPEPSNRIKVFNIKDLKLQKEILVSIKDCQSLAASKDGKLLYALDRENGQLAVIDIATGKEVKVIDKLGAYPLKVLPLPEDN